jgi:HYR domain/PKD domain
MTRGRYQLGGIVGAALAALLLVTGLPAATAVPGDPPEEPPVELPPPPPLSGSVLRSDATTVTGDCGSPSASSTYQFSATGSVERGNWFGATYTESGAITLGPLTDGRTGLITSMTTEFTIVHPDATITGTKTYSATAGSGSAFGTCRINNDDGTTNSFFSTDRRLVYDATFSMPDGRICAMRGLASLQFSKNTRAFVTDVFSGTHGLLSGEPFQPTCETPPPSLAASFTWQMADRFGRDDDADGLIDYVTRPEQANGPWALSFDACSSIGAATFEWTFPDHAVPAGPGCRVDASFPTEGTYPVTLTITSAAGAVQRATNWVTVRDWLVVSLGDSSASGEGSPDHAGPLGFARWQSNRCRRSANAGAAKAALALEQSDTRSSVTFIHLACSGAGIDVGILGPYAGQEKPEGFDGLCDSAEDPCLPAQLDETLRLVGDRQVDAMLITAGANDLGFVDVIANCFLTPAIPGCWNRDALRALNLPNGPDIFDSGVADKLLPAYERLGDRLPQVLLPSGVPLVPAERVFITEYFDPTHGELGLPCKIDLPLGLPWLSPIAGLLMQIDPVEATWASDYVVGGLRDQLYAVSQRKGWRYIGGIAAGFKGNFSLQPEFFRPGHGYCTTNLPGTERWVGTVEESLIVQGSPEGAFHPNYAGQRFLGQRMYEEIRANVVTDSIPPTITPTNGLVEGGTYAVPFSPTFAFDDAQSGMAQVSFALDGAAWQYGEEITALGAHTLQVSARDGAGNVATAGYHFRLADLTAPVVTAPGLVEANTDPGQPFATVDPGLATATDNLAGVIVTGARSDGQSLEQPYPIGTTTITWTATDAAGNTATAQQAIHVIDAESPQLVAPADLAASTDPGAATATLTPGTATATDNAPGVSVSGVRDDGLPLGAPYRVGTTSITWTATDGSANTTSAVQRIVVSDAEAPRIAVADLTVNATSPAGAVVTYSAAITDNVAVATSSCAPASGSAFAIGTTTVTCTAVDAAGNTATAAFTVTVKGASGQVVDLRAVVAGMGLSPATATTLDSALRNVQTALAAGSISTACRYLGGFAVDVARAVPARRLTAAQAIRLLGAAARIAQVTPC